MELGKKAKTRLALTWCLLNESREINNISVGKIVEVMNAIEKKAGEDECLKMWNNGNFDDERIQKTFGV